MPWSSGTNADGRGRVGEGISWSDSVIWKKKRVENSLCNSCVNAEELFIDKSDVFSSEAGSGLEESHTCEKKLEGVPSLPLGAAQAVRKLYGFME